jgi:hypothetical protein
MSAKRALDSLEDVEDVKRARLDDNEGKVALASTREKSHVSCQQTTRMKAKRAPLTPTDSVTLL